ncbi:MAG: hypothetical protein ACP6IP_07845 [Candidatus Njordarchaeia archaeon]
MYYEKVFALNELLGEEGILRLPSYLPQVYVVDEERRNAIDMAAKFLLQGKNVLIGDPLW